MEEIKLDLKDNLDSCVYALLREKARGDNAFAVFNGHVLYSQNVNLEDAYKLCYGKSRDEYLEEQFQEKELRDSLKEKKQEEFQKKMVDWITRGENVIYPERCDQFLSFMNSLSLGYADPDRIEKAIYIMEESDKGTSSEDIVRRFIEEKDKRDTLLLGLLFNYCKTGPEIIEKAVDNISPRLFVNLISKRNENGVLEKKYNRSKCR